MNIFKIHCSKEEKRKKTKNNKQNNNKKKTNKGTSPPHVLITNNHTGFIVLTPVKGFLTGKEKQLAWSLKVFIMYKIQ